jgi:hypothetical protein
MGLLRRLGLKRLALLLIAPGFIALVFDVMVGHFMGKDAEHFAQGMPIGMGISCCVLTLAAALLKSDRVRLWLTRAVGVMGLFLGIAGTYFHVHAIQEDLADEETISRGIIEGALGAGPPALAPLAFVGVGLLVMALGSRKLRVELVESDGPAAPLEIDPSQPSATKPGKERAA